MATAAEVDIFETETYPSQYSNSYFLHPRDRSAQMKGQDRCYDGDFLFSAVPNRTCRFISFRSVLYSALANFHE